MPGRAGRASGSFSPVAGSDTGDRETMPLDTILAETAPDPRPRPPVKALQMGAALATDDNGEAFAVVDHTGSAHHVTEHKVGRTIRGIGYTD